MSLAVAVSDVNEGAFIPASEAGPAPKRIVVAFGFWVFLLSDIVMFSVLFAAYAVLVRATAGEPSGAQLFNQVSVAVQTACLLISSYTCGMMSLAVSARQRFIPTSLLWSRSCSAPRSSILKFTSSPA